MNHYATIPEYRARRRMHRAALAAFIVVGILAGLFIATAPNSHASSAQLGKSAQIGVQVPRCAEDQVISRRASCLDRDDATTRFRRVSEAGWGYWVDTRHPRAMSMRPLVVACKRWQMVTRYSGCVATRRGDFRGGWWYHR